MLPKGDSDTRPNATTLTDTRARTAHASGAADLVTVPDLPFPQPAALESTPGIARAVAAHPSADELVETVDPARPGRARQPDISHEDDVLREPPPLAGLARPLIELVLNLRRHMPRSWYVWSYERMLPAVYKVLGQKKSGVGSGLDASHFSMTDVVVPTTPVLFAVARKPRRFPEP